MNNTKNKFSEKCHTGTPGLDEILGGGLPRGQIYLLQGKPGTGKTTLALKFLLEGAKSGEKCLYITFSETKQELELHLYWLLHKYHKVPLLFSQQFLNDIRPSIHDK